MKSGVTLILVFLVLLLANYVSKNSQRKSFSGVITEIQCVPYGKSDIGLRIDVVGEGPNKSRSFKLPPKEHLCKDIYKDNAHIVGKNVVVIYSDFYGFWSKSSTFSIDGYGDIESNRI
ncbi:hypothetical protein [Vibrio genomosp. F10]|uniref:hypothetical protein n=1 Tax=Vibrio genomosp. F10 TaxID=723171 RepID=UPI00037B44B5|nr:hypothetical protein [Vibrio genomosp. F10]OEF06355.1 hypothetical protein A1QI_18660 [Vibrio genomosp. F10 str. 9ZB36]